MTHNPELIKIKKAYTEELAHNILGLDDEGVDFMCDLVMQLSGYKQPEDQDELQEVLEDALELIEYKDLVKVGASLIALGGSLNIGEYEDLVPWYVLLDTPRVPDPYYKEAILKNLATLVFLGNKEGEAKTLRPDDTLQAIEEFKGYRLITTNAHGYLFVPFTDPYYNQAYDLMSKYSYINGFGVYLEEDVDLNKFIDLIEGRN